MEKTIQDVLAEIAKYAETHDIDADGVAKLFAAGCDDCGYEEFTMLN